MRGQLDRRSVRDLLPGLRSPAAVSTAMTVALVGLAGWLTVLLPAGRTLLPGPGEAGLVAAVVLLAAALVAADLTPVDVSVRQRPCSVNLVALPLVPGLLYLPPEWVIAARIASTLAVLVVRRPTLLTAVRTGATSLLGVTLVASLLHWAVLPGDLLTGWTALGTYVALAVVEVLMTVVALLLPRTDGTVGTGRPRGADALLTAVVTVTGAVAVSTSIGLLGVLLFEDGPLGRGLLALVVGGVAVSWRAHLVLRRRYDDQRRVRAIVDVSTQHEGGDVLAAGLLGGLRELVRGETARLVWRSRDGEAQLHTSTHDPARTIDAPVMPPAGTAGLVPARTPDPQLRDWLRRTGAREALVVDLERFGGNGLVVVTDHLGGGGSQFTGEDVRLADALAAHLVVRLRNTDLVDRLRWEATHDTLTGLPNRRVLLSTIELFLGSVGDRAARAVLSETAVLVMVVDRLGEVTDALGHDVADQVLCEVARRLVRLALPGATVVRLSGEHFAVAVPVVGSGGVAGLAAQLRSAIANPVALADAVISVGARVGIATTADGDVQDAAELLRRADAALAAARSDGRDVLVYAHSMDSGRSERLALLGDLHRALAEETFQVYYQPKLDLAAGRVTGVEALVRWDHPVLGPISPDVFVPLAESAGLVDRLTDIVLTAALSRARAWQDEGLDLVMAVNLSVRSLDDARLSDRVAEALRRAGVLPNRLVLEITETSLMSEVSRTLPVLQRLADMGVGLSLDDFGTGYSSLAYLQRLPVSELKVDQAFVTALEDPTASGSVALVGGILGLASALGLSVVAEGVESARAMSVLRGLGCRHVQGFLVSRPVTAAALPGVVRAIDADPAWSGSLPAPRERPVAAAMLPSPGPAP